MIHEHHSPSPPHHPGGLVSTLLLHPLDTLKIRSAAGKGSCSQTIRILARWWQWQWQWWWLRWKCLQKHKSDIDDTNLMTILTFVFDQSWCLGWPARSLSRNKANICCCFFLTQKMFWTLTLNYTFWFLFFLQIRIPHIFRPNCTLSAFSWGLYFLRWKTIVYWLVYFVMCRSFSAKRCEWIQ